MTKPKLTLSIVSLLLLCACAPLKTPLVFQEHFTKQEYYKIAKEKGITNDKWIDRLYGYEVNINNFDQFKKKELI